MASNGIITVNITAATVFPSAPGFGTPLIATVQNFFSGKTAIFTNAQDVATAVVAAGGAVTDPPCLIANKIFSQNPSVTKIKFGFRTLPFTQTFTLVCLSATAGDIYSFTIGGIPITYTVPSSGSPTTSTVATAIAALITTAAPAGLNTAGASTATITVTANAGKLIDLQTDKIHFTYADTTADPGIATDLAAINVVDSDWYGLIVDSRGTLEQKAAEVWVEANTKLMAPNCSDTIVGTTSTSDMASAAKASSYKRSAVVFSEDQLLSYMDAAWMGSNLSTAPGSENWAFTTLAGVTVDNLTSTVKGRVLGKNGNVYTTVGGYNIMFPGITGSGQFIDITRGLDWLSATMQQDLMGLLANNIKVPFTDPGAAMVGAVVSARLQAGVQVGFLAANPAPVVTIPKVSTVSPTDRANRNLPGVSFTATLAGAINTITISGTVTI